MWVERVERALQRRVRHGLRPVHERLGRGIQHRGHRLRRGILVRSGVAPDHAADLAQVDLLGERRARGNGGEGEEAVQLSRSRGQELAIDREHLGRVLHRPERGAANDRVHLVEAEQEGGHDAEVAAASADGPVEVRVLVGARANLLAAGQDHFRLQQVVDTQPALAREVPEAPAEGEAPRRRWSR